MFHRNRLALRSSSSNSNKDKHVVVIGAGIVGICTSIWLGRAGFQNITLLDAVGVCAGASEGNAGFFASCAIIPIFGPSLPLHAVKMLCRKDCPLFIRKAYLPALAPWLAGYLSHCRTSEVERVARDQFALTGDSVEQHRELTRDAPGIFAKFVRPTSNTSVYSSKESAASDGRILKRYFPDMRELNETELREYFRAQSKSLELGPDCKFALQIPGHAFVFGGPGDYVRTLAAHAADTYNVKVRVGRVTDLEVAPCAKSNTAANTATASSSSSSQKQQQEVRAVKLEGGERIDCDAVVVAAGAFSMRLLNQCTSPHLKHINIRLESERGYHVELSDVHGGPEKEPIKFAAKKFIATPMAGRLRLAGLVEFAGLDEPLASAPGQLLIKSAKEVFPNLTWKGEPKHWMGHRPSTTDALPVIDFAPGAVNNVVLAFGHQHLGLTAAPKTGRLVADLLTTGKGEGNEKSNNKANDNDSTNTKPIDMTPYRADRF